MRRLAVLPLAARAPAAALVVALLAVALPAAAQQQIYKWKDARGVAHYGERPPASGNYSTLDTAKDPSATPAPGATPAASGTAATTANAAPDPRCNTARSNLATLQGGNQVQMDSDGDGKPDKSLSDAERTGQMELARATLKAYNCSESAPST